MIKRNQHYVWQNYLKSWAVNGSIACCRKGKLFRANTSKVASERLFYKLQKLTGADRLFIEKLAIEPSSESLRPIHRAFVDYYCRPWSLLEKLKAQPEPLNQNGLDLLEQVIANFDEDYHMKIESDFEPILRSLLQGYTSFYQDQDKAAVFLFSLNVQYLRTKKMRAAVTALPSPYAYDLSRVWSVLSHILAKNGAMSFFRERGKFKVVVVENVTNYPFVTGDQPVINLCADPFVKEVPEKMNFYYPLSPTRAMFYVELYNNQHQEIMSDPHVVQRYNTLIAQHAHEQIFGISERQLKPFVSYVSSESLDDG